MDFPSLEGTEYSRAKPPTIREYLAQLQTGHVRLLLIAGSLGPRRAMQLRATSEAVCCQWLNLSLALSKRLLDLPERQRALQASEIIAALLAGNGTLVVDHIELLFAPTLQLDALRVLKAAGRHRPLLVIWPGMLDEGNFLVYAEPGHPEYRRYGKADLADMTVVDTSTLTWEN